MEAQRPKFDLMTEILFKCPSNLYFFPVLHVSFLPVFQGPATHGSDFGRASEENPF